jgi:PAS domain S-box-containing protein
VNQLEDILREQRLGAVEATELLRKVLEEVDLAIFAFDEDGKLRLVNRAGERLLGQRGEKVVGRSADELRLADALRGPAPRTIELAHPGGTGRWEVRRSRVRQEGLPLELLVLSDLSRALREEERQMWKRIIRVLSHEINNSLAPIKSISGSLATLVEKRPPPADLEQDMEKGLSVIQTPRRRARRFMSTYATLARLAAARARAVDVPALGAARRAARDAPAGRGAPGPALVARADPDQLEQALINLIRNAVDAHARGRGRARRSRSGGARRRIAQPRGRGRGPGPRPTRRTCSCPSTRRSRADPGSASCCRARSSRGHGGTLELENRGDRPGRARAPGAAAG